MAETAEQLVVSLEARVNQFEKAFQRASRAANDNWRSIEKRGEQGAKKLESTFAQATRGVSDKFRLMATSAAGALTAALGVNQLKRYADEWTAARSKIAATGEELSNVAARQNELTNLAIASRSSLGAVVDLYTGLARSTKELGSSQAQVLRVTELISKAFATSGASSETASGAILQLNQAMSSGALRGDELNSVLEGAPPIARLIAKEFGVSVGQLKSLGEQGKLTADRVFQAILKGGAQIESEFAKTTPTISQAFNILNTAMTRYIGEADQATGASAAISGALASMAGNINVVAPLAFSLAAGLAAAFAGGPIVGGIVAATTALVAFGSQVQPISGELANLGDYAAVAWGMIREGATDASSWLQARFAEAAALISSAMSGDAVNGLRDLLDAVKIIGNSVIGVFVATTQTIKTAWTSLGGAIAEAMIDSMNAVIAAAEAAANKVAQITSRVTFGAFNPAAVDLGRIENTYKGAGDAAAKGFNSAFDALGKDYIGSLGASLDDIRKKANERAATRNTPGAAPSGGSLSAPLKSTPATGKGGKSKADKPDDFAKEVADLEKRARAYDSEREALGKIAVEQDRAKASLELFEAAKKAGLVIDDALRAKIDSTADAYARSKDALDKAKESQEAWQSAVAEFGSDLKSAFSDAILEGKRLDEVLQGLVKKLASRALDKGFDLLFAGATKGLSGGLGSILGFAEGGMIQGPGGPRSDSILAAVSDGEFVVNADATKKYGALLAAINSGHVPKFAAGGIVGSAPTISSPKFSGAPGMGAPVNVTSNVTLNATGGSDEQNAALSRQVGKAMESQLRGLIVDEMRRQGRPGNILHS
jgi:tape measure domain-containing protein